MNTRRRQHLKAAYCDYLQAPRPELDQSVTLAAIEGFQYFQRRFPQSDKVSQSQELIKELQDNLVEKSYLSARLYYDLKQYRAAIVALSNSLKEFPETKFREELLFLKLESSYLYAVNSISEKQFERYQDTLDEYYSFIEEFPESAFTKEIEKIYRSTADILKIDESN
ncbi:MAG: outer membrane protein assembly factor BamD [Bacteroidales bacterium]